MLSAIDCIEFKKLNLFKDSRGELTELFNTKTDKYSLAQLNYVSSLKNSFRGMHLHSTHSDYLVVLSGTMLLALKDCRKHSNTFGVTELHTLNMQQPCIACISPGVAHGFYFPEDTIYCYGLSHPWDVSEKLGFRWNAPDTGFDWPMTNPEVSERDAHASTFSELMQKLDEIGLTYE
ncbi:dTDP-4-dehydrorhamnose 3,5-epimerase family protein [Paraglaciecola aestuariivivens]